jgi:U2 small nuclear ribonucleoprotein A'
VRPHKDEFETIDLSDNEIAVVENFPVLRRLGTLFLANNKVRSIRPGLGRALPRLEVLVLSNNAVESLGELAALGELPQLRTLSLLGNPVARHASYRALVLYRCRALETLDFARVTRKERYRAEQLFAGEVGAELLRKLEGAPEAAAAAVGGGEAAATGGKRARADDGEAALKARIVRAIQQAQSLDEVSQLQRALQDHAMDRVLPLLEQIEAGLAEGGGATKKKKADE